METTCEVAMPALRKDPAFAARRRASVRLWERVELAATGAVLLFVAAVIVGAV